MCWYRLYPTFTTGLRLTIRDVAQHSGPCEWAVSMSTLKMVEQSTFLVHAFWKRKLPWGSGSQFHQLPPHSHAPGHHTKVSWAGESPATLSAASPSAWWMWVHARGSFARPPSLHAAPDHTAELSPQSTFPRGTSCLSLPHRGSVKNMSRVLVTVRHPLTVHGPTGTGEVNAPTSAAILYNLEPETECSSSTTCEREWIGRDANNFIVLWAGGSISGVATIRSQLLGPWARPLTPHCSREYVSCLV